MAGMNGRVIGGFRILQTIQDEASGQGQVYRAVCEDAQVGFVPKGREVALKVMPVQGDDRPAWQKLEKRTRELALMDHPGVVKYYGCFTAQGEWSTLHVVVQEYLKGETLKERLRRFPSGLDVDEALKIADATLSALVYTSGRGIVHRDVKPGNIFLCESAIGDGRVGLTVKLIDFEIARQQNGTATTATGAFQGSLNYMAPELLSKEFRGDTRSDIFSMGVVLHEMLTGSLPYDEIDYNERDAILDFVSRWKDYPSGTNPIEISRNINRILVHTGDLMTKSLAPDREARFASFEEFKDALGKVRFRVLVNQENGNSYKMLQIIGKGGFGEVFKARESKSGRLVAVKHLLRHKYIDRFVREAKIISKFDDDRLVKFVEYFDKEMDGRPQAFLVMSFLDGMPGSSLRDAIKRVDEMPVRLEDVVLAFIRYAQGLKALHSKGIFHRDIKPSNLYYPYGRPGRAAIMDLGIARDTHGTMTFGDRPGTPDYMPYEVLTAEKPSDGGVDIYALGLCLYEALTSRFPFPRLPGGIQGYQKLIERANDRVAPKFVLDDVASCRAALKTLIRDMTEIDPARRIQDADVVCFRLKSILKELRQNPQPPPPIPSVDPSPSPSPGSTPIPWHRWLIAVSAVVAMSAIVVASVVAFPRVKSFVAEWQLDKVVNLYERGAIEDAMTRELVWIKEWDPDSLSLCTLDHETFAAGTNQLVAVKSRQAGVVALKKCVDMLARCKGADGKLDKDAYGRLDGWEPPAQVDVAALREAVGLETAVVDAVLDFLDYNGDVATRASRLARAKELVENSLTRMMLEPKSHDQMRARILEAETMCVGKVVNRCGGDVEVGEDKIVMAGKSATIALKADELARTMVFRKGFKPFPLPSKFDGLVYVIDDSSFEAQPVEVTVPVLEDGVCFRLEGDEKTYAGGEKLSLKPGTYRGQYERSEEFAPGKKKYKDAPVDFAVGANLPIVVSAPVEWAYSKEYDDYRKGVEAKLKELKKPVDVDVDGRAEGVKCEIDGKVPGKKLQLAPGGHVVVYSKDDYVSITNSFEIAPGQPVRLVAPKLQENPALRALARAEAAFRGNKLDEAQQELEMAAVVGAAHVARRDRLKTEIAKEKKRRMEEFVKEQNMKREVLEDELKKLMADSPVGTRRVRLGMAREKIAGDAGLHGEKLLSSADADGWREKIAARERWFVGEVSNACDTVVEVAGQSLKPGASRVLKYESERPESIELRIDGYEPFPVGLDFDGGVRAVDGHGLVMSEVEVSVPHLEPGIDCYFNGQKVADRFKLKPGDYTCVYRRSGYEDQMVTFKPAFKVGCALPSPGSWRARPVVVTIPQLEGGVVCKLNGEEVSGQVARPPGRYAVTYSKLDSLPQRRDIDICAGMPVELPPPLEWEESEGARALREAEGAMVAGDLDNANKWLPKVDVRSDANVKRRNVVKDWVDAQARLAENKKLIQRKVGDARMAYGDEGWLNVLECFSEAKKAGYDLTDDDYRMMNKAYKLRMSELKRWKQQVDREMGIPGKSPLVSPLDIERHMKAVGDLYRELRR